jgi:hypothetical protein
VEKHEAAPTMMGIISPTRPIIGPRIINIAIILGTVIMMLDGAKNLINVRYKGLCAGFYDESVTVMVD